MSRGDQLQIFCDEFEALVLSGYGDRFYSVADEAWRLLTRKHGQRMSKRFKDNDVILELRNRRVMVKGKLGTVNCDGSVSGRRPRTGCGTRLAACPAE